MAFDRDGTLKKAEKLVRQGRLDQAIAEYVRVVDDNPGDWSTANTLGELYAKAGQAAQAIEQYTRIGEHFAENGFYPKAAALYKKILKLRPNDEGAQMQLADISAKQGLLADAKSYLNAVAARRKARGDSRGAAEIVGQPRFDRSGGLRGAAGRGAHARADGRRRAGRASGSRSCTPICSRRAGPPKRSRC